MTDRRRIISMRLIVTVATAALMALGVLVVGMLSERHTRRTLTTEIESRLLLQARNLALMSSTALLDDYPELTLHPLIKEMQAEIDELAYVLVVDREGIIQGHSDARSLGQGYQLDPTLKALDEPPGESGERLVGDERVIVALAPVYHPNGRRIGTALVGLYRHYIADMVQAVRSKQIVLIIGMLIVGILLAMVLMSKLLQPIGALRAGLERIGRGDMDTPIQLRGRTELGMLAQTVNEMAGELKQAQTEMVEKERLAREMDLARGIQGNLLPAESVEVKGFHVVGSHRAAFEVGGDYYDYFALPNDRVGLAIADVSGKGLVGCMIMSMLSTLLRSRCNDFDSPAALLINLEEELRGTLKLGQFITMFYGILDTRRGCVTYASAAHSPLLVYRADGGEIEWQRTKGIPLGAMPGGALGRSLCDIKLELDKGDLLVQYTDGINEAFNDAGEQFEFERIEKIVSENADRGPESVLEGLQTAVREWSGESLPSDDETLLVIGRDKAADRTGAKAPSRNRNPAKEKLIEAQARGWHLELSASLRNLNLIHAWLAGCPELRGLSREDSRLVESALYEICANVVEHGYGKNESHKLDLWWVPPDEKETMSGSLDEEEAAQRSASKLAAGYFLVRDHGMQFSVEKYEKSDFKDPAVRKRGRGLGLELIHQIASRVTYHPNSSAGNLTILQFSFGFTKEQKENVDV